MAAKRLWEKTGEAVDSLIHAFTVGSDPVVDKNLVCHDAVGSAAHARMLKKIGFLTSEELVALLAQLKEIFKLGQSGAFEIPFELEDVHTAIEARLVEVLGVVGKKIHTGRSRNDQVILAMRLYLRAQVASILESLGEWGNVVVERFAESGEICMPGYTHMQPAMPSSVGMWLHAFLEANICLMRDGLNVLDCLDTNPLGSAAGFGVPIPLDREFVAKTLSFSRVQRSVIDVQNTRGRYEAKVLNWCTEICFYFEKLAWDIILYSSREFGFFTLAPEMTTGSSIMPQKHNPDVLELMRARASRVRGANVELENIIAKLPSNYHRDFQYTKEPVFRALNDTAQIVAIGARVLAKLTFNREVLKKAMYADLYATYEAYRHVSNGKAFRDAYQLTADKLKANEIKSVDYEKDFLSIASATNNYFSQAQAELASLILSSHEWASRISQVEEQVLDPAYGEGRKTSMAT